MWPSCCGSVFAQSDHVWPSYGGDRVYPSSFDRDVYLSSTDNPVFRTHPSSHWYIHQDWAKRREILVNMNLQTIPCLSPTCFRHHEPYFNYFSRLQDLAHDVPHVCMETTRLLCVGGLLAFMRGPMQRPPAPLMISLTLPLRRRGGGDAE